MSSKLKTFLRSGYAALYAVTHEEERIMAELTALCDQLKFKVYKWSPISGIEQGSTLISTFMEKSTRVPQVALSAFNAVSTIKKGDSVEKLGKVIENRSVLILTDFHLYLAKRDPELTRLIKDAINWGRETARAIIVMSSQLVLPPELEKEFTVVDFPLPSRTELLERAVDLCKYKGVEMNGNKEEVIDAGVGLTINEFSDAVAASLTEHNMIKPDMVAEIKAATIKKGGLLEIIKPGVSFDNLGGLDQLKNWIKKRRHAFGEEAQKYGLPIQKGVILFGVQGAGKSFATRAIATEMACPLIRLDSGRLFSGLVGSSEANVRSVINQVEAFGRCILQVDEIDKGFGGMGGHDGDGGTTRRVIGSFLTWMAEKTSPVFIVATANDLTRLPPELLRKGRWDELFFIDLPTFTERVEIWKVQIKMKGRSPKAFDIDALATATDGWTGAEIEALMNEGLFAGFDMKKEPTTELLLELSREAVPLSKTMAEQMYELRKWAKGRCRMASAQEETSGPTGGRSFVE